MGRYTGKKCRLISMFWLTLFFFLVEIVVGYVTNSMALVADSFHMLSDVAALVVAFLSVKMSPKKWSKNTFGWARAEVLGALVNAVFLVALCFSITVEACKRFIEKEEIHQPLLIVVVGALGLLVNIVGLFLFHGFNAYGLQQIQIASETLKECNVFHMEQYHITLEERHNQDIEKDPQSPKQSSSQVPETHKCTSSDSKTKQSTSWLSFSKSQSETKEDINSESGILNESSTVEETRDPPPNSIKHGTSHGHSHGGFGRSHGRLTHLVATDDNENDETFQPPVPAQPTVLSINKKDKEGHAHDANSSASQMNMRGVFLHVLADALGSVIVIISAAIVHFTDWDYEAYIDPALSLVLVVLILKSVWPLLQESALILLQTVPTHIQVDAIQRRLLDKVDGVLAVHEFHVWQLAGDRIIASAHIRCRNLSEYMKIAEKVKEFFHNEGIHSTTIQPEFVEVNEYPEDTVQQAPTEDCVLDCPKTDKPCTLSTCCGPSKHGRDTPSPGDTPYMCRQRNSAASFNNRVQELSEMESGHLLATSTPCSTQGNGSCACPAGPCPSAPVSKESCV